MQEQQPVFKPYVPADSKMAEFTIKSVVLGAIFGIIFGAANVYLALKAGLTVSASIPISVMAISLGRKLFKTTILENNIIQTTGSAGESIASGVAFTLPAFLFLSLDATGRGVGIDYFNYLSIFTLAVLGGVLGTLMMIPLRRSLIVKEHGVLPYPEGTACASVLIAGEKGGDFSKTAYMGLAVASVYAIVQKIFHVIAATPTLASNQLNKYFPSATLSGEITPEYLGVGYIIGPRIAGVLVAGGVLAWLGLIPLLATLVPMESVAAQLVKLGYLKDVITAGSDLGWDPLAKTFEDTAGAIYYAYVRQIGAGAVAVGGLMTLIKTIPTIIRSFKESVGSLNDKREAHQILRTDRDLSFKVVILGSLALVLLILFLPQIPGHTLVGKFLIGILVVIFGFFFVTVSSRIVGLIGASSSPISGMTIATIMGTCLIFISVGWTGQVYEPMALVVGAIICISAANAGATSQDLKTGYIIGGTPKYQQIALFVGAIVSSLVIGWTLQMLDTPTEAAMSQGIMHTIGTKAFPAPQGTLMATLIRGLLSFNLDWQYVLVGAFLSITIELCGVNALSFAVGAYLPLSTTSPIWVGGLIKYFVDRKMKRDEGELGHGSLFATGLVAGGAVAGVLIAFATVLYEEGMNTMNLQPMLEKLLGSGGYQLLGFGLFMVMAAYLYKVALKKSTEE